MAATKSKQRPGTDAVQWIGETLSAHDAAIKQLAEVVVNLHANVSALRAVVEALAGGTPRPALAKAAARLRRVKLER